MHSSKGSLPPEIAHDKNPDGFKSHHPNFFENVVKIWSDIEDKNYEICCMLLVGKNRKEIADHFVITPGTVDNHCSVISQKLSIPKRGLLVHLEKIDRGIHNPTKG